MIKPRRHLKKLAPLPDQLFLGSHVSRSGRCGIRKSSKFTNTMSSDFMLARQALNPFAKSEQKKKGHEYILVFFNVVMFCDNGPLTDNDCYQNIDIQFDNCPTVTLMITLNDKNT